MACCRGTSNPVRTAKGFLHAAVVAVLCFQIALPGELVAAVRKDSRSGERLSPLTPAQKATQALNRLTFGPRPGDVAAVQRMGLEAWFQQQLHPERIADGDLDARLARYPALRLNQVELVSQYPTPEMLRRYSRGSLTAPDDNLARAIYADASLRYEEKFNAKSAEREKVAAATEQARTTPRGDLDAGATGTVPSVSVSRSGVTTEPAMPLGLGAVASGAPAAKAQPADSAQNEPLTEPVKPAPMPLPQRLALFAMPAATRWQQLVVMSPEEMQSLEETLRGPEEDKLLAGMTPQQAEQVLAMRSPERVVTSEVLSERLLRDVYSARQLQAVMTDFWLNHFSVYLRKNQNEPYLLPAYEREAVLPNALGTFEELLVATAKSPAMLVYLDNWESIGPNSPAAQRAAAMQANHPGPLKKKAAKMPQGINENYARELMELHTLGVKGGYTQQDVIEVAKCFTGWTIDRPAQGGEFLFNPNRHEPGDKLVLGHVIREGGVNEGLEVLHLLATSPATAHFVSQKLAERFVSDNPPQALVDRMAASYMASGGDIKVVLTTLFHSAEFWSAGVYRAKVKTPVEFVASALRATGAEVSNPLPSVQALDRLGMPLYGMQTPNGYSWKADAWVSSNALLTRMNFALVLASGRLPGTKIDWPGIAGQDAAPNAPVSAIAEDRLEDTLLNQPAAMQTRAAVLAGAAAPGVQQQAELTFRATPVSSAKAQQEKAAGGMLQVKAGRAPVVVTPEAPLMTTAGLLLGSPDFQRR